MRSQRRLHIAHVAQVLALDTELLHRKMAEVVQEQGEAIFGQFSDAALDRLRREGLRIDEQTARLERINEAIHPQAKGN